MPPEIGRANRRPACPLNAGLQLGSTVHAPLATPPLLDGTPNESGSKATKIMRDSWCRAYGLPIQRSANNLEERAL